MNQTAEDYFIYCEDDPVTMEYINKYSIQSNPLPFTMNRELNKGAFINERTDDNYNSGDEKMQMSIYDFALEGKT